MSNTAMRNDRSSVHARTLLGAIDAHRLWLAAERPAVAAERLAELEALAIAWMDEDGENWLPSLAASPGWLSGHVGALPADRRPARVRAAVGLLDWARAEALID